MNLTEKIQFETVFILKLKLKKMKNSCSVIIPLYNKKKNIELLIIELEKILIKNVDEFEIVIIDNNSKSNTFEKLLEISSRYNFLRPILMPNNNGLGPSIWEGLRAVRNSNVIIMNADSYQYPNEIPEMLSYLNKGKLMVWRSRYKTDKIDIKYLSYICKNIFSYSLNFFIKFFLKIPIFDTTYGFFAFKYNIIPKKSSEHCFNGHQDFTFLFLYYLFRKKIITNGDLIELPSKIRVENNKYLKIKSLIIGLNYIFLAIRARIFSLNDKSLN